MKCLILILFLTWLTGCSPWLSYANKRIEKFDEPIYTRATFDIKDPRGKKDVLVLLALSGGGSRAAYFSGMVMLELQKEGILDEVDLISSVSGGSLPAAYYCLSKDPSRDATIKDVFWPEPNLDLHKIPGLTPYAKFDKSSNLFSFTGKMTKKQKSGILDLLEDKRNGEKIKTLYKISRQKRRKWDDKHVREAMEKDYEKRLWGSMLLPHNILLYWASPWDRSDILAQVFADNLFDTGTMFDLQLNNDFTFEDLNAERPYLILNATDGTENTLDEEHFGEVFTFTKSEFEDNMSDIRKYPISKAVAASSAFPGFFSYVTIRDYSKKVYIHVFDGGNADNLGLKTLKKVIDHNKDNFKKVVVILVDSFVNASGGVDRDKRDGRKGYFLARLVDTNFLDSMDILLKTKRDEQVELFEENLKKSGITYWHICFQDLISCPLENNEIKCIEKTNIYKKYKKYYYERRIREKEENIKTAVPSEYKDFMSGMDNIPTRFYIKSKDSHLIDEAVKLIFIENKEKLKEIKKIIREAER